LPAQNAGVNRSSAPCYGLKIKIVAVHFDQHEIPISVETHLHLARKPQIVESELSRVAEDKIVDIILWFQSFVNMFVPGKDHVDLVFLK